MSESPPIVQAIQLTKSYNNGKEILVLDKITFAIKAGEFIAVVGPSGSGKSTLLNLIGTLDVPTDGKIVVNNVDTSTLVGNELADFRLENIGFVFQAFNLIPALNVLENVMLPLLPYQKRLNFKLEAQARQLLTTVALEARLKHRPSQLSGGEQQRVAIARAMVNTPKIILADEPTGNLDTKAAYDVFKLLKRLNQELGITVIMATHNENLAREADHMMRFHDGKLVSESG